MSNPRGSMFVVSAPSGAGKNTLHNRLMSEHHALEFSGSVKAVDSPVPGGKGSW